MNRKMISLTLAITIVVATAAAAFALDCNGVAKAVKETIVTVLCDNGAEVTGENVGKKIKAGDKVQIIKGKVRPQTVGC